MSTNPAVPEGWRLPLLNAARLSGAIALLALALPWAWVGGLPDSAIRGIDLLSGNLPYEGVAGSAPAPSILLIIAVLSAAIALLSSLALERARAAAIGVIAYGLSAILMVFVVLGILFGAGGAALAVGGLLNLAALLAAATCSRLVLPSDWRRGLPEGIRPYSEGAPIAAFFLGISSGFPLTLLLATMGYWLSRVGIDKSTIGFAIGLTTPYTLKFLWAPLIDKLPIPFLTDWVGQRRAWLFVIQALLFGAIWGLGASQPEHSLGTFAFWAIVVAFLSATQDIVIDAYRIEILSDEELPHGTAMNQFGYRTGNLWAGVGTIWLYSSEVGLGLGWALAYGFTAFAVLPAAIAALLVGPGRYVARHMVEAGQSLGAWLRETVVEPFANFLKRRGALLILLFVLIYKVGDAMGQGMLNPMIVDLGFSDAEYIAANKLIGFWALIIGSAIGAPFIAWLGMGKALFASGVLMMVSNLGFAALAMVGHSPEMLGLAVGIENLTTGIGLTVFVTYLSGLSSLAYTATQFALLSSLAAVGRTWLATPAGILAEDLGWVGFYLLTTAVAFPGLLLLWILWRKGFVVESVRQPGAEADRPVRVGKAADG